MDIEHFRRDFLERVSATQSSQAALVDAYGIQQAALSRFIHGKSGLSFNSVVILWPFVYGAPFPNRAPQATPTTPPGDAGGTEYQPAPQEAQDA